MPFHPSVTITLIFALRFVINFIAMYKLA